MKILIVDDEKLIRRTLDRALASHHVTTVSSCSEAREALSASTFDFVLSDLHLDDGTGTELYDWLCDQPTPAYFALMTGSPPSPNDCNQLRVASYPILSKPFGRREVLDLIQQVTEPRDPGGKC